MTVSFPTRAPGARDRHRRVFAGFAARLAMVLRARAKVRRQAA